ncbi:MAG: hypothetical protein DLM58_06245 [Pseudonocardiales bacterium]|nr:MAG: hypothetical protein DLM58_06245 [Pseudonocardiales bacterium]
MTSGNWDDVIRGERWRSTRTIWVEDDVEYSWAELARLADAIEDTVREQETARVVRILSDAKLGCFAGQLAAWRAGCVAVTDDGRLGPAELERVRPDLTVTVSTGPLPRIEGVTQTPAGLPADRLPDEVVAVNFTSGTSGSRKAVAVMRGNLLALWGSRALDTPTPGAVSEGAAAGSFATPTYDGWWFDTWRTVAAGGTVACLPGVNDDVFAWPELARTYGITRVLLPAAVVATIVDAVPSCLADIPTVFSGGEAFRVSTYRQARGAGLTNRFVNLYGPTEATFASHGYVLPAELAGDAIPIGTPLDGSAHRLRQSGDAHELVITGTNVCLGYVEHGIITRRFVDDDGRPYYPTGDVVRADDDGNLVFAGRLDGQIKVNGMRVDAAAVERRAASLPGVLDCRVVQSELHTVAFVRTDAGSRADEDVRVRVEQAVADFSSAIAVQIVERFPLKAGGKVDTASLMDGQVLTENGVRT